MKLLLFAILAPVFSFGQISISGSTVDASGKPLPGVEVTLRSLGGTKPKTYNATSSDQGKFAVAAVEANTYSVSAKVAGFVLISVSGCSNQICELKASTAIQLRLVREGIITGRVVDANNNPVKQTTVSLSSGGYFAGAQPANEQGEFRIAGLAPGRYQIRALPLTDYQKAPVSEGETHLVMDGGPKSVEVQSATATPNITISMKPHPVVRVSGSVTGAPNALIKVTQGTREIPTGVRAQNGKFEIWRLEPGSYVISALGGVNPSQLVPFTVANSNVDGIDLVVSTDNGIKGKVVWDNPPEGLSGKPVLLSISDTMSVPAFSSRIYVGEDGTFQTTLSAQPHLIRVEPYVGIPRSTYVKSIRIGNGKDQADHILDTSRPVKDAVTIVLSTKGAEISGTVSNGSNGSVVLVGGPREGAQRFRLTVTDDKGHYLYEGVPPGSYKVAAVDGKDYWEFVDSGSLGAYETGAERVDVKEGDKVVRNLKRR